MNEEETRSPENGNDGEPEPYGWDFHKVPLLIALVLTVIFYAFVYFFINY